MPGMVDCHTHHNGFGDGRLGDDLVKLPDEVLTLQSARNARASLFSGVTTFRENGPKNYTMFRLRDAVNEGIVVGPRMVLCGRPIAIIGGHMGYFGSQVTGAVEARAMTRQLIKEGADYIKITATGGSTLTSFPLLPSFNVDELEAITDEAHKFGKLTAAHCSSTQGTVNSLDAGVDMIIHCVFKESDGTNNFRADVAERIGEQGAFVNPTLRVTRARIWTLQHKLQKEGLTPEEQSRLDDHLIEFEVKLDHCRRMMEMGLKVITGSDSSWSDYQLGNTVYETECLVMAGLFAHAGHLIPDRERRDVAGRRRQSRHSRARQRGRYHRGGWGPGREYKRPLERVGGLPGRSAHRPRLPGVVGRNAPATTRPVNGPSCDQTGRPKTGPLALLAASSVDKSSYRPLTSVKADR